MESYLSPGGFGLIDIYCVGINYLVIGIILYISPSVLKLIPLSHTCNISGVVVVVDSK